MGKSVIESSVVIDMLLTALVAITAEKASRIEVTEPMRASSSTFA